MKKPSLDEHSVMCGFCDDFLRCIWTKMGSEMSEFHDLLTHLSFVRDFTSRKDRISATRSWGRIDGRIVTGTMTL